MRSEFAEPARRLKEVVDRSSTFLLSGHVNIDGDSLGSMLAMYHYLSRLGKMVRAMCFEPLHERYAFLGGDAIVEVFDPERHRDAALHSEVFMMFDFSATSRMPGLWELVESGSAFKICVDHHPAEQLPGDFNIHEPSSPATGAIVLDLFRHLGAEIDRPIADALLVAISTDTGWFRYSNTTAQVLADAAALISTGIDPSRVYREVYQRNDVSLIRLMGRVAANLHAECGDRLLWATIPAALVHELGVGPFETDELLDFMRTARDAEVIVLLRELDNGEIRVNLRSRGRINVSELARAVGGGGHRYAAGASLRAPLSDVAKKVVSLAREALAADRQTVPPQPTRLG